MNINLPLILTLAVLITGLIWVLDIVWFAPRRRRALAAVERRYARGDLPAAANQAAFEAEYAEVSRESAWIEYSKSFFPVLLIVFVLRSFVAEPFQIPSGSMEPTLQIGDFILVNKYTYGIRLPVLNKRIIRINEPQRGDVMVFFPPHQPDIYYIKRVIGVPGDEIQYVNNQLYINGELIEESDEELLPPQAPRYRRVTETIGDASFTVYKNIHGGQPFRDTRWVVPDGHYFTMGDNRDNSLDSRGWGMVSEDAIVGKAFAVWMHWDSFFSLPSFNRAGAIE